MPVASFAAVTTPGTLLFTVPLHMKARIDAINFDNEGTHGQIQFALQDVFSQDVSVNNNTVNTRTAQPWVGSVPAATSFSADVKSLLGIECLGAVYMVATSATDAAAVGQVQFHFE